MSELEDLCKEVLKTELEVSEKVIKIQDEYETEEIEQAVSDVVEVVLENVEDPAREERVYKLMIQLGQSFNSDRLVLTGKKLYENFIESHAE